MIIDGEAHPIFFKADADARKSEDRGGAEVFRDLSKQFLDFMEKNGIDSACIMPTPVGAGNIPSKVIEEASRRNPGRFIPFCRFFYEDPIQPGGWAGAQDRALDELARMLSSGSFKGVGEFDFYEVMNECETPSEAPKKFHPFMDVIAKYRTPVEFHMGLSTRRNPIRYRDPILLDDLASRYPEVPILINHCGGMLPPYGDVPLYMAAQYPNIFLVLSNHALVRNYEPGRKIFKKYIENALQAFNVGAERLIFATDWSPDSEKRGLNSLTVKCFSEASMSESERDLLMGGNMKRILGM